MGVASRERPPRGRHAHLELIAANGALVAASGVVVAANGALFALSSRREHEAERQPEARSIDRPPSLTVARA